jgi:hypothetical protein
MKGFHAGGRRQGLLGTTILADVRGAAAQGLVDRGPVNARTCVVSFVDSGGIRHSVEVAAESLYEAAALAVREFRRHPWTDGMEPGAVTRFAVSVKAPATTHEVSHPADW